MKTSGMAPESSIGGFEGEVANCSAYEFSESAVKR